MSDELVRNDDLGLKSDPALFSYSAPQRPGPQPGKLYERADVNSLEEVPYRPLCWFWTGRIPWNKLTVIEGPPQSAKSLVAIELASRASRGEPLPGDPAESSRELRVELVSGYDDLHDTVLPRIKRAGGIISNFEQLSRVARSRGDDQPFAWRKLTLPGDIRHFEESISDVCADVVIVDPLTCFCKSGRDVTETLELLDDLASRIGIPIIATLPAKTSRNAIGRWESQPAFSDAPARCVWSIVADEDEPRRWLFVPTRMTFATPAEGMAFRVVDGRIAWEPFPALSMAEQDEPVAWL
ncbi:MAG TPA: AAA family ATPase, partial [Planctomycetaceae bacterium]